MSNEFDFSDIAPYDDNDFNEKISLLVEQPGFKNAVMYVMPDIDYASFAKKLASIHDKNTFQREVMLPFLSALQKRTTVGIDCSGIENISPSESYAFMSNHRDIVLDASFLNLCLIKNGFQTSEIAIGSNLLIFDWITDLVKLNKSFIVKRNIQRTKALEAARQLSAYIHYAINTKHESIWIAQREGRAKDSNDLTQESLVKMLGLEGGGTLIENIKSINIVPVSISYEFDPNDYLKAREFLLRKLDPEFKKSQHDDLLSMETGLMQNKGRVHFSIGRPLNSLITDVPADMPRLDLVKLICKSIDAEIHAGYYIYPVNYIAYDQLHHTNRFADKYTDEQKQEIESYVESQLDKVDLPDVSMLDREFMREMMYAMYANPLRNKLAAEQTD